MITDLSTQRIYRYHSDRHFSELLPTRWRQKSTGIDMEQTCATVTLFIQTSDAGGSRSHLSRSRTMSRRDVGRCHDIDDVALPWRSTPADTRDSTTRHGPHSPSQPSLRNDNNNAQFTPSNIAWLGSRVVSVLDSGAEGPGFKSQSRRCLVTVLGKLLTPIVPLFSKQQNW